MRSARIVAALLALIVASSCPVAAVADNASDIQARVTEQLEAQGVRHPGLFAQYALVRDGPFAIVQAGLGSNGNSSEMFAFSKTSGRWKLLLSGGGLMGASELTPAGIPESPALELERTTCSDPTYRSYRLAARSPATRHDVIVRHARLSTSLVRAARASGTSALPGRTVEIVDDAASRWVIVYPPLDFKSCTIETVPTRYR